jgi:hypothetical protein
VTLNSHLKQFLWLRKEQSLSRNHLDSIVQLNSTSFWRSQDCQALPLSRRDPKMGRIVKLQRCRVLGKYLMRRRTGYTVDCRYLWEALVSKSALLTTRKECMELSPAYLYQLGWMCCQYLIRMEFSFECVEWANEMSTLVHAPYAHWCRDLQFLLVLQREPRVIFVRNKLSGLFGDTTDLVVNNIGTYEAV